MKNRFSTLLICALLLSPLVATAQQYSNNWYKVSGGGGTSTNGPYAISGTIGQHDAGGPMTGGLYSVYGGFWAIDAVQTLGLPKLIITFVNPHSVKVSWSNSGSYTLQQNSIVSGGTWTTSVYAITTANGTNSITVTPPTGNLFFRLSSP